MLKKFTYIELKRIIAVVLFVLFYISYIITAEKQATTTPWTFHLLFIVIIILFFIYMVVKRGAKDHPGFGKDITRLSHLVLVLIFIAALAYVVHMACQLQGICIF